MKLRENQWGFDLDLDNPFLIFPYLRKIAIDSVGIENVVDLSRGDPGFGYIPSVRGREFYGFLLELDQMFNCPDEHFSSDNRDNLETLLKRIEERANAVYVPKKADRVLEDFHFFLTRIAKYAGEQGLDWDKETIIREIFKYSSVSGGSYLNPKGEPMMRLVVADHFNKRLGLDVDYSEVLMVQGVSHGIGTVFKLFNDPKIGYITEGDYVMMASPVYAPYNNILNNRGIKTYTIPLDPTDGSVDGDLDEILAKAPENLKMICLIDPNNPSGMMHSEEFLEKLAQFAKERNIFIVSDEVYSDFFFERKKSVMAFARERTIFLGGISKIERATGLRSGQMIIAKEAQKYIAEEILGGKLGRAKDLMQMLVFAKAPGGVDGEFQHVTFTTGPSQFMGMAHMIFGDDDRNEYLKRIRVNMENFYEILGMEYKKNLYYSCFDLRKLAGEERAGGDAHEFFIGLAKKGVVVIPANLFFSEEMRERKDYKSYARACLPNVTFTNLQKAARLIKEYMAG